MTNIKPSDHGIVVEDKETGIRFARTDDTFDPKTQRKVRDLRTGETVLGYVTKAPASGPDEDEDPNTGDPDNTEELDFSGNL